MKSYTSQTRDVSAILGELSALFKLKQGDSHAEQVRDIAAKVHQTETDVAGEFAVELRGLDMLDVGPGQLLGQMHYFQRQNRVVGIDFDVIGQGINPFQYLSMLRVNGVTRTAKTLGRKFMGYDRRFRQEIRRQLNLPSTPKLDVRRMDAGHMTFPDRSFDFVYSFATLHHILDPGATMRQVVRVLRPRGIAYLSFQLYTCATGALDFTVLDTPEMRRWGHLRPQFAHLVHAPALNKLRLPEWRQLFDQIMPGSKFIFHRSDVPELETAARSLQSSGELTSYSLEELLTHRIVAMWRKPE